MFKRLDFPNMGANLLVAVAFLLPVFFLPFTNDLFDLNKRFLFVGAALLLSILAGIHVILKKEILLTRTPWTTPVIIFGLSTLVTLLIVTPNKITGLLGNGGMYLSFVGLFLIGSSLVKKNFTEKLILGLSLAGVIVTLVTLLDRFSLSITGVLNSSFGLVIPATSRFYLTGSPLFSVFFLGLVVLMLGIRFFQTRSSTKKSISTLVFALVCLVGLLVNGEGLLPGRTTHPEFLSLLDSWSVATDVLKTPARAAFGIGTDSYATAYSLFKPLHMNQTPVWFIRFNNARNILLELLTTQGLLGALSWGLILLVTLRLIKTSRGEQTVIGAGTLFIEGVMLFFPPNTLLVGLLCIFLIAWSVSLKERGIRTVETKFSLLSVTDFMQSPVLDRAAHQQGIIAQVTAVILIILTLVGFYGLGRAYAAETWFNKSVIAATKGKGQETYDFAVKAIVANPYMENYHRAFAVTNLSLAQAISQNKNLSDQDKQNVLTLVQQAIQQAKIATTLNPFDTANWDTLTMIYQTLIGAADGATQWTIASYVEQIKTDPTNPQVRFNLGSAYRTMGNDDMALRLFDQATQLKSDYANAYYNEADIYKKKGDKVQEAAMLQTVLSLVKPDQTGYDAVKNRLNELQAPAPTATPKPTPSPTPTVQKVNLPKETGPQPADTTVPEIPKQ